MSCIYDYEDKEYNIIELTKEYYKSKSPLTNTNIFSDSEKFSNNFKVLDTELKNKGTYLRLPDSDFEQVTNFITKEQPVFFKSINEESRSRLAPEYIRENRIVKFIEQKLDENAYPSLSHVIIKQSEDLKLLKKVFPDKDDKVLQYYLDEILDVMTIEEKTKKLGIGIHKLIESIINGNGISSPEYNSIFDDLYEENKELLIDQKEE